MILFLLSNHNDQRLTNSKIIGVTDEMNAFDRTRMIIFQSVLLSSMNGDWERKCDNLWWKTFVNVNVLALFSFFSRFLKKDFLFYWEALARSLFISSNVDNLNRHYLVVMVFETEKENNRTSFPFVIYHFYVKWTK